MPNQDSGQPAQSPFDIVTPKKAQKLSTKGIVIASLVTVFLGLGAFLGVLLVRQNQNVEEEAVGCVQQCAVGKADLVSCDGVDTNGAVSKCSFMRIETCGGKEYCCPAASGSWTTDLTKCAALSSSASPSATATSTSTAKSSAAAMATATSTSTARSSATATATAKATSTTKATATAVATKPPVPETGTGWPTYFGIGLGVLTIMGSLFLAL